MHFIMYILNGRDNGRHTEEESIMNLFYTLLFYNFVMQMKFSLGNIIYFNNVSNSYIKTVF